MEVRGHIQLRSNQRNLQIFDSNNDASVLDMGGGYGSATDRIGYIVNRNAAGAIRIEARNLNVQLRVGEGAGFTSHNAQFYNDMSSRTVAPSNFNSCAILTTGSYGGMIGMKDNAGAGTYFGGMYLASGYIFVGVTPANATGPSATTRFDPGGEIRAPNQIYLNAGWFRSQQSGTGWYHEAHGGGWFMQDNNWIRSYNNKGLLLAGGPGSGGAGLRIEGTSPTIECYDSDGNTSSWIHNNDGNHGFLAHNAFAWACFRNSGNDWQCQNNVIAYASDRRLKKNIEDVPYNLVSDFFDRVRIRQFDWDKEQLDKYKVGIKPRVGEIGAVAQEMQEVYPDAVQVNEAHNQIKTEDNPNPEKPDFLTINWEKTVPLLIAEIQQLRARVTELEKNV